MSPSPGNGPNTAPPAAVSGPLSHDSLLRRLSLSAPRYLDLAWRAAASGVSATQFGRFLFPFVVPPSQDPPVVSIEFTNECNLACVYCDNPLKRRARGFMSAETFAALVASVRGMDSLVKVTGNGECTLHPDFSRMMRELGAASRHLIVMTNAHWTDPQVADDLLCADLVSVSVDAGTPQEYEASRRGAQIERLKRNLRRLAERRRALGRSTRIAIRLMVRPTQQAREREWMAMWEPYADAVLRAYVYRLPDVPYDDVFEPPPLDATAIPRCGSPFKEQDVNWDGNVPLCGGSARQVGPPGVILGNVRETPLRKLWSCALVRQYREGHRSRDHERTPICGGCIARY